MTDKITVADCFKLVLNDTRVSRLRIGFSSGRLRRRVSYEASWSMSWNGEDYCTNTDVLDADNTEKYIDLITASFHSVYKKLAAEDDQRKGR